MSNSILDSHLPTTSNTILVSHGFPTVSSGNSTLTSHGFNPSYGGGGGGLTHGSNYTITGTGFGTKATQAAPVVWDDCSGTNPLSLYDLGYPVYSGNTTYGINYRALQRGVAMPHAHVSKYLCGAHNPDSNVMVFKGFPKSAYLYMSWYDRVDPGWSFGGDNNLKTSWYGPSTIYAAPGGYISYQADPAQGVGFKDTVSTVKWVTSYIASPSQDEQFEYPDAAGHPGIYWNQSEVNPTVWKKFEIIAKISSGTDGYWQFYENNVRKINYIGKTDQMTGTTRYAAFGGYARNYPDATNWRYFNDLYLDTTPQRVILTNSATYSSATIVEPQVPSIWTDTSITVKLNHGKLSAGTAYLFVFDATGAQIGSARTVTLS